MSDHIRKIHGTDIIKANDVDRVHAARIYKCSPEGWELQVRGPVRLSNRAKEGRDFIIAGAHLEIKDLEWLHTATGYLLAEYRGEPPTPPHVDAEGVCDACEAMPEGSDGRANFCAWHRKHPTTPTESE